MILKILLAIYFYAVFSKKNNKVLVKERLYLLITKSVRGCAVKLYQIQWGFREKS